MFTFKNFQDLIERQLRHNRNKSLFYELANRGFILSPSDEMIALFRQRAGDIICFLKSAELNGTTPQLIKYISGKTKKLFLEVNQYLDFSSEEDRNLQKIYEALFERVYTIGSQKEISDERLDQLFRSHYKNLQTFLLESNGEEIFKKYRESPELIIVKCEEYTPEFQLRLMNIHFPALKEPLLDIGCGRQAGLVCYLRGHGIAAYGIDRLTEEGIGLYQVNWLDYTFVPNTWGTIVSHMAFSNHFMHHHLRPDGDYEIYAKKYMEIVKSLKTGGSFIYAPSLSFMEEILSRIRNDYAVETMEYATKITRIY